MNAATVDLPKNLRTMFRIYAVDALMDGGLDAPQARFHLAMIEGIDAETPVTGDASAFKAGIMTAIEIDADELMTAADRGDLEAFDRRLDRINSLRAMLAQIEGAA